MKSTPYTEGSAVSLVQNPTDSTSLSTFHGNTTSATRFLSLNSDLSARHIVAVKQIGRAHV